MALGTEFALSRGYARYLNFARLLEGATTSPPTGRFRIRAACCGAGRIATLS
ncbi:MAG: hypothetical protein U1F37_00775 [Alphaproteobacteria bacterium]